MEEKLGSLLSFILSFCSKAFILKSFEKNEEKLLFVKFIEQGALVLHLHTFLAAQKKIGRKNVYLCTFESNRAFIRSLQIFDKENVCYIRNNSLFSFAVSYLRQAFVIRKIKISASVDLEFLASATVIFSILCGIPHRAAFIDPGFKQNRNKLINVPTKYSAKIHVSETGMVLLRSLFEIESLDLKDVLSKIRDKMEKTLPKIESEELSIIMNKEDAYKFRIIIHPNFNDPLPLRKWPEENYSALIQELNKNYSEAIILITGREDEFVLAQRFMKKLRADNILNLCGKTTWTDLLNLYRLSDILICSDSGPAHFASIFNLKTVVMFGPETPELYGPVGNQVRILYKPEKDAPDYDVYNNRMVKSRDNSSMRNISVQDVMGEIQELLAENAERAS